MAELVDRQAAIDALNSEKVAMTAYKDGVNHGNLFRQYNQGLTDGITALMKLPTAQPEQRWIPCSERMPEEREWIGTKRFGTTISDEVYVTFERPDGKRFVKHIMFQNGALSPMDQTTIDAFNRGAKPIAWKPLPEPYQEGEQDESGQVHGQAGI